MPRSAVKEVVSQHDRRDDMARQKPKWCRFHQRHERPGIRVEQKRGNVWQTGGGLRTPHIDDETAPRSASRHRDDSANWEGCSSEVAAPPTRDPAGLVCGVNKANRSDERRHERCRKVSPLRERAEDGLSNEGWTDQYRRSVEEGVPGAARSIRAYYRKSRRADGR